MANFGLEIIHPVASATGNRSHKAYPGISYNIRAGVIGGTSPFVYELTAAPVGMVIDQTTGEITWSNPTTSGSPHTVTMTVTDMEDTTVSVTWSLTVTTTGFVFLDAAGGNNANDGTLASPKQTLSSLSTGFAGQTVYLRAGTYDFTGLSRSSVGSNWERVEFGSGSRPHQFIGYPGESVVLDFNFAGQDESGTGTGAAGSWTDGTKSWDTDEWAGYFLVAMAGGSAGASYPISANTDTVLTVTGTPSSGMYFITSDPGVLWRVTGNDVYLDNMTWQNMRVIGVQPGNDRTVIRRINGTSIGPGADGANSSMIMTVSSGSEVATLSEKMVIQDTHLTNGNEQMLAKMYTRSKLLIEGCTNTDSFGASVNNFGVEIKFDVRHWTIRGCTFTGLTGKGVGGNMNSNATTPRCTGEIEFSLVYDNTDNAFEFNQDSDSGIIYARRNTFVGRVRAWNVGSDDGPFYLSDNVIVNEDSGTPSGSHVYHDAVTDASRIILGESPNENLVGAAADNIVDANGLLTGAYRTTYLGLKGHEIAASEVSEPQWATCAGGMI